MKISTLSKKGRTVVAGCLLLTLLLLVTFYFTEGSIKAHFLSFVSGISTDDQPTTYRASDGSPNLVNTSFTRNTEKVSMNESRYSALTGLEAEPVPGERHIIFLETLCVLNDSVTDKQSGLAISPRQACAVASAANTNPDSKVYLLYTCSIIGNLGDSPEYVKQMMSYPNVRIWKLVISDYIKGTPLDSWDFMVNVRSSNWPVVHASDVLRYITLWKYGGNYLDMDFVIRKSLVELGTNYAVAESERYMGNAVLSFDMDTVGRRATDLILTDVRRNFDGTSWGQIGPTLIGRVLHSMCGTKHVTKTTRENCSGIAVLPPSVFFSIDYNSWKLFFDESRSDEVLKKVEGSYGVHLWNKMSSEEEIIVGSKQAYGLLAEKFCPGVYWNCGLVF